MPVLCQKHRVQDQVKIIKYLWSVQCRELKNRIRNRVTCPPLAHTDILSPTLIGSCDRTQSEDETQSRKVGCDVDVVIRT